ncbi:tyrosine-type recombinase/integrase [Natrinema salifodinae]|uniref:Site-specific recombinase XerD n=1 Tax=Natrinema salifodinae TaxID=1202768 RepID=A0A1I0QCN8_9EURY|nr:site-specific integrase [Natrinema salifodinae]SEW24817.1 Site-specific recombinase XerD [Natrinema salifodinae]
MSATGIPHPAKEEAANQRVARALQEPTMRDTDLQPLTPEDAKERYLRSLEDDKADSTIQAREYKLRHFIRWCNNNGVDNLNTLNGRDIEDYKHWRKKDGDLNKTTLRSQMSIIRQFLEYCGRIDGVHPHLYEQVILPSLEKGENRSEVTIDADRAEEIINFMNKFEYATRDHVVILILWKTGVRTGSLRALDLDDYHERKAALELSHRPETDTPLKNKEDGERMIALKEEEMEVLDDYIKHNRKDVTDEYGREPLITTTNGRIGKVTVRRTTYRYTRPCVVTGGCPHNKDPENCEAATNYDKASQCPDSVSAHPFRRGAITHHLNNDFPKPLVSDRMNVSIDVIDEHYDAEDEEGKMERRRGYLDNI